MTWFNSHHQLLFFVFLGWWRLSADVCRCGPSAVHSHWSVQWASFLLPKEERIKRAESLWLQTQTCTAPPTCCSSSLFLRLQKIYQRNLHPVSAAGSGRFCSPQHTFKFKMKSGCSDLRTHSSVSGGRETSDLCRTGREVKGPDQAAEPWPLNLTMFAVFFFFFCLCLFLSSLYQA